MASRPAHARSFPARRCPAAAAASASAPVATPSPPASSRARRRRARRNAGIRVARVGQPGEPGRGERRTKPARGRAEEGPEHRHPRALAPRRHPGEAGLAAAVERTQKQRLRLIGRVMAEEKEGDPEFGRGRLQQGQPARARAAGMPGPLPSPRSPRTRERTPSRPRSAAHAAASAAASGRSP